MIPSPRSIGHAIADKMKSAVLASSRYLVDWRSMAVAGVPPLELRHAMDRKVIQTEPMDALKAWDGEGCLALVGALESGKSHAAALWMLDGVRRTRSCVWVSSSMLLSWTDVEVAMKRALNASRFVLDDCGVGTISRTPDFQGKIEAVLHARHSASRPTIITSNANQLGFEELVGPRILSRMKTAGEIVDIEHGLELRKREPSQASARCPCKGGPECGHGDHWRRARWLVHTIGLRIEDRFDGDTYDEETGEVTKGSGKVIQRDRVGDALDLELAGMDADDGRKRVEWLASELGLDFAQLEASAAESDATLDKLSAKWEAKRAKIVENKSGSCGGVEREPPRDLDPRDPRSQLKLMGFSVTRKKPGSRRAGSRWYVLHAPPLLLDVVPSILEVGIESEARAWGLAATHANGYPPLTEEELAAAGAA